MEVWRRWATTSSNVNSSHVVCICVKQTHLCLSLRRPCMAVGAGGGPDAATQWRPVGGCMQPVGCQCEPAGESARDC
eukprot:7986-Eustigmatos_ZCMA.PRE.1